MAEAESRQGKEKIKPADQIRSPNRQDYII